MLGPKEVGNSMPTCHPRHPWGTAIEFPGLSWALFQNHRLFHQWKTNVLTKALDSTSLERPRQWFSHLNTQGLWNKRLLVASAAPDPGAGLGTRHLHVLTSYQVMLMLAQRPHFESWSRVKRIINFILLSSVSSLWATTNYIRNQREIQYKGFTEPWAALVEKIEQVIITESGIRWGHQKGILFKWGRARQVWAIKKEGWHSRQNLTEWQDFNNPDGGKCMRRKQNHWRGGT